MDEQIFKDISWLFQKLGEHLAPIAGDAPPEADTRKLLKHIIHNSHPTFNKGRNPFNWLKELDSTLNFWAHVNPTADLTEDEMWRDLHTLELVSKHLNLPVEFVDEVREVRARLREPNRTERPPAQEELQAWIAAEVERQLDARTPRPAPEQTVAATGTQAAPENPPEPDQPHGTHAQRVRDLVIDTYFEPARAEGVDAVTVRARDVDRALGFESKRMPLICSTLRSPKFLKAAAVALTKYEGPPKGAGTTAVFHYKLKPRPTN